MGHDLSYHAQDGLHFIRQPDGSVIVEKYTNDHARTLEMRVHLPASIWASAVSSMTRAGENYETFSAALERQMP